MTKVNERDGLADMWGGNDMMKVDPAPPGTHGNFGPTPPRDEIADLKQRSGIPAPNLARIPKLQINHPKDFGVRYSQQIHELIVNNRLGGYQGYAFVPGKDEIFIIGTTGMVLINYDLQPITKLAFNR